MFQSSTTNYADTKHDAALVALEVVKAVYSDTDIYKEAVRVLTAYFQERVPKPSCKECGK